MRSFLNKMFKFDWSTSCWFLQRLNLSNIQCQMHVMDRVSIHYMYKVLLFKWQNVRGIINKSQKCELYNFTCKWRPLSLEELYLNYLDTIKLVSSILKRITISIFFIYINESWYTIPTHCYGRVTREHNCMACK